MKATCQMTSFWPAILRLEPQGRTENGLQILQLAVGPDHQLAGCIEARAFGRLLLVRLVLSETNELSSSNFHWLKLIHPPFPCNCSAWSSVRWGWQKHGLQQLELHGAPGSLGLDKTWRGKKMLCPCNGQMKNAIGITWHHDCALHCQARRSEENNLKSWWTILQKLDILCKLTKIWKTCHL
jgi:hypothetical protein